MSLFKSPEGPKEDHGDEHAYHPRRWARGVPPSTDRRTRRLIEQVILNRYGVKVTVLMLNSTPDTPPTITVAENDFRQLENLRRGDRRLMWRGTELARHLGEDGRGLFRYANAGIISAVMRTRTNGQSVLEQMPRHYIVDDMDRLQAAATVAASGGSVAAYAKATKRAP